MLCYYTISYTRVCEYIIVIIIISFENSVDLTATASAHTGAEIFKCDQDYVRGDRRCVGARGCGANRRVG